MCFKFFIYVSLVDLILHLQFIVETNLSASCERILKSILRFFFDLYCLSFITNVMSGAL